MMVVWLCDAPSSLSSMTHGGVSQTLFCCSMASCIWRRCCQRAWSLYSAVRCVFWVGGWVFFGAWICVFLVLVKRESLQSSCMQYTTYSQTPFPHTPHPPPKPTSSPTPQINAAIAAGQWWRLVTPALLHGDLVHLAVNSYTFNNLGPTVERLYGAPRYLAVYFLAAVGGNVASYLGSPNPSLGASGMMVLLYLSSGSSSRFVGA